EDGIRDSSVTGVQTCALPIYDIQIAPRDGRIGRVGLNRVLETSGNRRVVRDGQVLLTAANGCNESAIGVCIATTDGSTRTGRVRSEERRVGKEVGCSLVANKL